MAVGLYNRRSSSLCRSQPNYQFGRVQICNMSLYKQTTAETKLSMNYDKSFQNDDIHNFSRFFSGLFSFIDDYDRTVSLKTLKLVIQAKITNINVE